MFIELVKTEFVKSILTAPDMFEIANKSLQELRNLRVKRMYWDWYL